MLASVQTGLHDGLMIVVHLISPGFQFPNGMLKWKPILVIGGIVLLIVPAILLSSST
jgi:hypothetical protein